MRSYPRQTLRQRQFRRLRARIRPAVTAHHGSGAGVFGDGGGDQLLVVFANGDAGHYVGEQLAFVQEEGGGVDRGAGSGRIVERQEAVC